MLRWLLQILLMLLPAVPVAAGWKVAETANFRVYSAGPEDRLVAQARLLEDYRALLLRSIGAAERSPQPRLDLFLVDRVQQATPWTAVPAGAAGFYRADAGRISAVVEDRPEAGPLMLSSQQILLHEMAHHILLGARGPAYPAWYVEGFAEYFAGARASADRIDYALPNASRAVTLAQRPWLPLAEVLDGSAAKRGGADAAKFYAQSWLMTHYLLRAPGRRAQLIAYLTAFAAGADPVAAFRQHVEQDFGAFERDLRRYLVHGASSSSAPRPKPVGDVKVRNLPPAADALLLRLVALEHGIPREQRPLALADIRLLVAETPNDPLARRALALAELKLGDPARALPLIDGLLADTPADPDLLRWRGFALLPRSPAELAEARAVIAQAFRADPQDWRSMQAWARLAGPPVGPIEAPVLQAMLAAHSLAPQVPDVVLDTGIALARAGRLKDAAVVLAPLARAPHGGEAARLAAQLRERALAGDREALLAEAANHMVGRGAAAAAYQRR